MIDISNLRLIMIMNERNKLVTKICDNMYALIEKNIPKIICLTHINDVVLASHYMRINILLNLQLTIFP